MIIVSTLYDNLCIHTTHVNIIGLKHYLSTIHVKVQKITDYHFTVDSHFMFIAPHKYNASRIVFIRPGDSVIYSYHSDKQKNIYFFILEYDIA